MAAAFRKYGKNAFTIEELETCSTPEETNEAERKWISDLDTLSPNGYNIRPGGECVGKLPTYIRDKLIGQKRTELSKEKMRKPKSREHREAFSRARWGKNGTSLTEQDVAIILQRYATGESQAVLARDFNVSRGLVKAIVKRRVWKQVDTPEALSSRPQLGTGFIKSKADLDTKLNQFYQANGRYPTRKKDPAWDKANSWLRYHLGVTLAAYCKGL